MKQYYCLLVVVLVAQQMCSSCHLSKTAKYPTKSYQILEAKTYRQKETLKIPAWKKQQRITNSLFILNSERNLHLIKEN